MQSDGVASPKDIFVSPSSQRVDRDVVDEAVLNELPKELQDELKRAMRGQASGHVLFENAHVRVIELCTLWQRRR